MRFSSPVVEGVLILRYKRFLADVRLADGTIVTAHCANTGSMRQVSTPGSRVILVRAGKPNRRTAFSWVLTEVEGQWAGVDTALPNILLREGFEQRIIPEFAGYDSIRTEVPFGARSRVDAVLSGPEGEFYVEAKNVTLLTDDGCARFPDAVTERGLRHLDELAEVVRRGCRAAMFFLVQRADAVCAGPAANIDPVYAARLREVYAEGVEIICWRARMSTEQIALDCPLPFIL